MASALRELLAKFTIDVDTSALIAGVEKVDAFAKKLTGLLDVIAGGDGFRSKFQAISDDLKERSGEIGRASKMLGISATDFQKLQFQSGASAETLSATFRTLQRNIGKAGAGAGAAASLFDGLGESTGDVLTPAKAIQDTFKKLGIDLKDSSGGIKKPIDVFGELGDKIGAIQDPSTRAAVAMRLFGSQGTALLPYFQKGGEELKALAKDFDDLGGGISEKTIKAYKDLGKEGKRLALVQTSLYSAIAEEVVPAMTAKIAVAVKLWSWLYKLQQNTNLVKAAILVFGAAIAWQGREALIAGAKTALAYAPVILVLAALLLIIDDLITTFEGGDSAIKRGGKAWLEWLDGGKASAEQNQTTWDAFLEAVSDTTWTKALSDAFEYWTSGIVDWISKTLGDFILWTDDLQAIMVGAGRDIAEGLIRGLESAWDAVMGSVNKLGKGIKDTFAKFFDAHSPSLVMLKATKVAIGGGIVGGLIKSIPDVKSAANDLYSTMLLPPASLPVPSVGGNGPVNQSLQQSNKIDITVQGGSSDRDTAASVRDAILPTLNDNARATLAALEPTVDNG